MSSRATRSVAAGSVRPISRMQLDSYVKQAHRVWSASSDLREATSLYKAKKVVQDLAAEVPL